jgi:uncharacterized protein YdeI (YjbR/CyaY-like superfamily)
VTQVPSLKSFRTAAAFRAWLEKHHGRKTELLLRTFKVHASHRGVTYRQALEEALCWGWIDGVRRSVDQISFSTRFSPRKRRSIWSRVNVALAKALIEAGRMAKPGLAALEAREEHRTGVYSFENKPVALVGKYARAFRANRKAWSYFKAEAPWYQRTCSHYVMAAKREETRMKRLELLVTWSQKGQRIPPLRRTTAARK